MASLIRQSGASLLWGGGLACLLVGLFVRFSLKQVIFKIEMEHISSSEVAPVKSSNTYYTRSVGLLVHAHSVWPC